MGGGQPDWEAQLRWLGRPGLEEVESRLKEIHDDEAARRTLAMFAATWEATKGFPETRKELADHIRDLADDRQGRWGATDKPLLEKLVVLNM